MYLIIKLTTIKGSFYLCKCSDNEYNALVTSLEGVRNDVEIQRKELTALEIWNEIEANESLREQEYMFITYADLVALLREVFKIEVKRYE